MEQQRSTKEMVYSFRLPCIVNDSLPRRSTQTVCTIKILATPEVTNINEAEKGGSSDPDYPVTEIVDGLLADKDDDLPTDEDEDRPLVCKVSKRGGESISDKRTCFR